MSRRALGASSQRIVSEIVRLLTPRYPALDEPARAEVHAEVVRFVSAQIGALPDFLRAPYLAAIRLFDALAVVTHGRRFLSLADDAKAAYLARWSEGMLAPMRNFVKLIRGCALLAYFDHPLVMRALESKRAAAAATPPSRSASDSIALEPLANADRETSSTLETAGSEPPAAAARDTTRGQWRARS